jgi:hypothetical protein
MTTTTRRRQQIFITTGAMEEVEVMKENDKMIVSLTLTPLTKTKTLIKS